MGNPSADIKTAPRNHLTRTEILNQTRRRMGNAFSPNQILGRTQTIGCTAVEITQRCNLDCTLCYLSEHSESVRDIPMEAVLARLDDAVSNYGTGTHVQITGGDPTLRKHSELIAIVEYAAAIGLHPALFTNGIAAPRRLLKRLAAVGLCDVAFHVDTTQRRPGYDSEQDLNALRLEYLERARDLGLMVIFNTTIHAGNINEVPMLVRFFTEHADAVGFASFQLQAGTGRGVWGSREMVVSQLHVRALIEQAAGRLLPWDVVRIGHPRCHSYMPLLVIGRSLYPVVADQDLFAEFLRDFTTVTADRHSSVIQLVCQYARALLARPGWCYRGLQYLCQFLWQARRDILKSGFRINKLSFFIQDFMNADGLDQERIDACSFMVMTTNGPVSMCAHNARRDDYILKPITVTRADGSVIEFQPLDN